MKVSETGSFAELLCHLSPAHCVNGASCTLGLMGNGNHWTEFAGAGFGAIRYLRRGGRAGAVAMAPAAQRGLIKGNAPVLWPVFTFSSPVYVAKGKAMADTDHMER
jgi:hypothetical protein